MQTNELRMIKRLRLKYYDIRKTLLVSENGQSKASLERCIKSLFDYTSSTISVLGIVELNDDGTDSEICIPLEVLETSMFVIDESREYRPDFLESSSDTPGRPQQEPVQALPVLDLPAIPPPPQIPPRDAAAGSEQPTASGWEDPWQNYEYFHQYGKLVSCFLSFFAANLLRIFPFLFLSFPFVVVVVRREFMEKCCEMKRELLRTKKESKNSPNTSKTKLFWTLDVELAFFPSSVPLPEQKQVTNEQNKQKKNKQTMMRSRFLCSNSHSSVQSTLLRRAV